jgi:hypothetical protein
MNYYYSKVVTTKSRVYVTEYSTPIYYNYPKTKRQLETYEKALEGTKETSSLQRARDTAKKMVEMNYTPFMKFVTLTYANAPAEREQVVKNFNLFAKRYKRQTGTQLKYLYTMEKGKRNTKRWHIHAVLFHRAFIPVRDLRAIWSHGNVKINAVDTAENIGLYLVKYITKDMVALNKKGFIASLGLVKPQPERLAYALNIQQSQADFYSTYSRTFKDKQGNNVTMTAKHYEFSLLK